MPSRALRPQFGETAGRVSGVDWLFGLDEADPWVKTYVIAHLPKPPFILAFTPSHVAGEQIPTW